MSRTLSLSGGSVTVDLMDGVFHFLDGSWSAKTAVDIVWETLDLFSSATDAGIRAEIAALEGLFAQARRYHDNPVESTPVWFNWRSAGESVKRSLVLDGTYEIVQSPLVGPMLGLNRINLRIAIQRQAVFESNVSTETAPEDEISATGGMAILSSPGGQINGRIASLVLSSGSYGALSRVWAGLRQVRAGASGFVALWEVEDGVMHEVGSPTQDVESVNDEGASGGAYARCNFITAGMYNRVTITPGHVASANFDHFLGRYLVLARLKVDASDTQVAIQLRQGWYGWSNAAVVGTTYISGQTVWKLVELGQIQIPTTSYRDAGPTIGLGLENFALQIWVERLSTAGTLALDCLILIPSEHLFIADGASFDIAGGEVAVYATPQDGDQYALGAQANNILGNVEFSLTDWEFPYDGALLVVAGQGYSSHILTPTIYPVLNIIPRWRGLRAG